MPRLAQVTQLNCGIRVQLETVVGIGSTTKTRCPQKSARNFSHLTGQWGFKKRMGRHRLQVPLPFEEIMRRHEREILRYLLRVSGDREDAADLFQETWLRAYRAYPRLGSESGVRPWMYAIATNLCRNRARHSVSHSRVVV